MTAGSTSSTSIEPKGWRQFPLGMLSEKTTVGFVGSMAHLFTSRGIPLLRGSNVLTGRLDLSNMRYVSSSTHKKWSKSALRPGDLVIVRVGDPGRTAIVPPSLGEANAASLVIVRPNQRLLNPSYAMHVMNSPAGKARIDTELVGGAQQVFNTAIAAKFQILLPPRTEQDRITDVLDKTDDLISALEHQVAKKEAVKQGMMQELLTGRKRLAGFQKPWQRRRIYDVLAPRTERNTAGESMEVLSCTKHRGFVRSLDFFKNQVFSRDLTNYRIIYRGDIGYPANHIEEGSIGVQDLFDKALVSPIYVVMYAIADDDTYFLQRQMKLESLRQRFARVTNASVSRRGSLRWKEFSQVEMDIPDSIEQRAIARVLRDAESEIETLRHRIAKVKSLKHAMMHELLTGSTRLLDDEDCS